MGGTVDGNPLGGGALVGDGTFADLVVEDDGGACDAIEASVAQAGDGVAEREIFGSGEGDDLRGG